MGAPRGSSEVTKGVILRAARELFAEHGAMAVTVRDIAAAAGVNHALVHRYFGTKEDIIAEILRREAAVFSAMSAEPGAGSAESLETIRQRLLLALTDGRQTLQLTMRAELAGLQPEKLLADDVRPLGVMSDWIAEHGAAVGRQPRETHDPALVSAVVGAALFSMVSIAPWLMTAVGLEPGDYEKRREEIVDILVDIVARAAGAEQSDTQRPAS